MTDVLDCPVKGCSQRRPRSNLVCRGHWYQLRREAPALALAVLEEYRAYLGPDQSREYYEARENALAHLDGREPDMTKVDRLLGALEGEELEA